MDDPADLASSLTLGFLTMLERLERLERLDPVERVVFLLADVFGEPFYDIAVTVDRTEAACRQIASRGRRKLRDPNRRRDVDPADQWRLAEAFSRATFAGDLAAIEALLAPNRCCSATVVRIPEPPAARWSGRIGSPASSARWHVGIPTFVENRLC